VLIVGRCRCSWVLVCGVVLGRVCRSWGGAGSGPLSSPFLGWCWAVVVIPGVVLGRCRRSWGGAGPGSSSLMLGVVMGHSLGGWWWALIAVRVDTLPLHSIVIIVVVAIRPSLSPVVAIRPSLSPVVAVHPLLSCCVGSVWKSGLMTGKKL